jgi:hypothetical protein
VATRVLAHSLEVRRLCRVDTSDSTVQAREVLASSGLGGLQILRDCSDRTGGDVGAKHLKLAPGRAPAVIGHHRALLATEPTRREGRSGPIHEHESWS